MSAIFGVSRLAETTKLGATKRICCRPGPEQLIQNPNQVAEQAWSLIRPGWDALQAGDAIKAKMWKTKMAKQPVTFF